MLPVYIDSDNACGSPGGDVDDGFALAALLASGVPVAAIGSVFGNTSEPLAGTNTRHLARLYGFGGPLLGGAASAGRAPSAASRFLAGPCGSLRVAALGPLTNVASALQIEPACAAKIVEIVLVGSNSRSRGRWPPLWPYEFNLTQDRAATVKVFRSSIPLTVIPLDVAHHFAFPRSRLEELRGEVGGFLRESSRRWYRRLLWHRAALDFAIYDLLAALYIIDPVGIEIRSSKAEVLPNGCVRHGRGAREIRVVTGFDRERLWERFVSLVNSPGVPQSSWETGEGQPPLPRRGDGD